MPEPSLQDQARALGDPTRHSIFRYVADSPVPVGVAELTDHLGLNHNAIRQHLARLVEAGLLLERTAPPTGRGRPRLLYRENPNADSRWGVTGPYERLAILLAEVVRSGDSPEEVGRRAGLRTGSSNRSSHPDPMTAFSEEMARQGFSPTVERNGSEATVTLMNCPFESVVPADADTVCGLHLGLARGVAEAVGGLEVTSLEAHEPKRAECRLRCHVGDAPATSGT